MTDNEIWQEMRLIEKEQPTLPLRKVHALAAQRIQRHAETVRRLLAQVEVQE